MTLTSSARTSAVRSGLALLLLIGVAPAPAGATDFGMFAASPGPTPLFSGSIDTQIYVSPGEEFTTAIKLILEPGDSVTAFAVSVHFDTDFLNELDIVAVSESAFITDGLGTLMPLTTGIALNQESTSLNIGRLLTFESFTPGPAISTPGNYTIGTITFRATSNVITDGFDAALGLFNPGVDGVYDASFLPVTNIGFGQLEVNLVPEPSTALLVGAGLLSMLAVARRRAGA